MGLTNESLLLSWGDVFGVGGALFVLLGLAVAVFIARRPEKFWPALLVVNIVGNGPRLGVYLILDEIFTGFIVLGALVRLILVSRRTIAISSEDRFWTGMFLAWIGYMVVSSIAGMLEIGDPKLLRWVIFYLVLGALAWIACFRKQEFPFPAARSTAILITNTSIIYFGAYLAQGFVAELVLGRHGRFLTQDYLWAGPAVAVFPLLVAVPAAVFLWTDRRVYVRLAAYFSIALVLTAGAYYDSRMTWLVSAALLLALSRIAQLRRLAVIAGAAGWFVVAVQPDLPDTLAKTATALWSPQPMDVGRILHLRAGVNTAFADWQRAIRGGGFYTHRFLMIPYVQELLRTELPPQTFTIPGTRDDAAPGVTVIRTQGLPALLVDTGLVGVALFFAVLAMSVHRLIRIGGPVWPAFTLIVVVSGFWLLSNNLLEVILFYMLFMPHGLLDQWAKKIRDQAPELASQRSFIAATTLPAV